MRFLLAIIMGLVASQAWAESPTVILPVPCSISATPGSGNNYSATVGASSTVLIPAPAQGITRTAIYIELLTSGATLGINPSGGTASTTAAGNIPLVGAGTWINFNALGFMPQGAITVIADSSSRVVTAFACPS